MTEFEEQVAAALADTVEALGREYFVLNPYDSPPRVPLLEALAPRVAAALQAAAENAGGALDWQASLAALRGRP